MANKKISDLLNKIKSEPTRQMSKGAQNAIMGMHIPRDLVGGLTEAVIGTGLDVLGAAAGFDVGPAGDEMARLGGEEAATKFGDWKDKRKARKETEKLTDTQKPNHEASYSEPSSPSSFYTPYNAQFEPGQNQTIAPDSDNKMRELPVEYRTHINRLLADQKAQRNELIARQEERMKNLLAMQEESMRKLLARQEESTRKLLAEHEASMTALLKTHKEKRQALFLSENGPSYAKSSEELQKTQQPSIANEFDELTKLFREGGFEKYNPENVSRLDTILTNNPDTANKKSENVKTMLKDVPFFVTCDEALVVLLKHADQDTKDKALASGIKGLVTDKQMFDTMLRGGARFGEQDRQKLQKKLGLTDIQFSDRFQSSTNERGETVFSEKGNLRSSTEKEIENSDSSVHAPKTPSSDPGELSKTNNKKPLSDTAELNSTSGIKIPGCIYTGPSVAGKSVSPDASLSSTGKTELRK